MTLQDKTINYMTLYDAMKEGATYMSKRNSGIILPYKTPHRNINKSLFGGYEPGSINIVGGRSGVGKTTYEGDVANSMIRLNPGFPMIVIRISLEEPPYKLGIKEIGSRMKLSHRHLLTQMTQEEFGRVHSGIGSYKGMKIFVVENAWTVDEIIDIIYQIASDEKVKEKNLGMFITVDHLVNIKREGRDLNKVVEMFMERSKEIKYDFPMAAQLLLTQLNSNIEAMARRSMDPGKLHFHYPQRDDLYGTQASFHLADTVDVIHRPDALNITKYGPKAFPAKGIIFWHRLKGRAVGTGILRFENRLDINKLISITNVKE